MTTRSDKLKAFLATHLIDARRLADDGLAHLMAEYGGSTLCGQRALSLPTDEARKRAQCETCADKAALRAAKSA